MATGLAALPFDALILWTMKRSYNEIKGLKKNEIFSFLSNASYFVIGFNNITGIAFSIFGLFYLNGKHNTLGYAEAFLWDLMISWIAMQAFQNISLASFHLYLAEFV